ncbi:hypothetical protein [Methanobrevibacter sp.]|uniref:hypothetical protein n=1 Tax=Methanobrevibacter sp. TaxID=66852 RepID=UPI00388FF8F8
MVNYPKVLTRKELKKISKYPCDDEIKDAYLKYLTNYSFKEFVEFCQDNDGNLEKLIFKFTDLRLDKFEPNSLIWVSHVMINFMIYFNVNLDYGEFYDAYASALQLTVLSCAMDMVIDKVSFDEVPFPQHSKVCFDKFFDECADFRFNLEKDCELAYKSFNNDFGFTSDEFYLKVKKFFEDEGY